MHKSERLDRQCFASEQMIIILRLEHLSWPWFTHPIWLMKSYFFFLTIGNWSLIPDSLWSMPSLPQRKKHLLESISAPLKCQDLYLQIHCALFPSFISWRYPAKTAGFCRSASVNVFIFTTNIMRVEIFWWRKTDSCSSKGGTVYCLIWKKNLLTSPDNMRKAFNIVLMYSNLH